MAFLRTSRPSSVEPAEGSEKSLPVRKEKITKEPMKEKPVSKTAGRKAIMVLLIGTFFLSAFFYARPNVRLWLDQVGFRVSAGLFSLSPQTGNQKIIRWFRGEADSLAGQWSFWVVDGSGRLGFGESDNERYAVDYFVRLPTILASHWLVEKGTIRLTDMAQLLQEDKRLGRGVLKAEPAGATYTVGALLMRATADQDETAVAMISRTWPDDLKIAKRALGVERWETARQSPLEAGMFWNELIGAEWWGETTRGLFFSAAQSACQIEEAGWSGVIQGCQFDLGPSHHHGVFLLEGARPTIVIVMSADSFFDDFVFLSQGLVEQIAGSVAR